MLYLCGRLHSYYETALPKVVSDKTKEFGKRLAGEKIKNGLNSTVKIHRKNIYLLLLSTVYRCYPCLSVQHAPPLRNGLSKESARISRLISRELR